MSVVEEIRCADCQKVVGHRVQTEAGKEAVGTYYELRGVQWCVDCAMARAGGFGPSSMPKPTYSCLKCSSKRLAEITAKPGGLCVAVVGDRRLDGEPPDDIGIGSNGFISFSFCLDCGTIQNEWPLPKCSLELQKRGVAY